MTTRPKGGFQCHFKNPPCIEFIDTMIWISVARGEGPNHQKLFGQW